MLNDIPFQLQLTTKDSCKIKVTPGQGSFAIGTKGVSVGKYDALVSANEAVLWHSFDLFTTSAGSFWPRVFYYSGNDTSFLKWSENRRIEQFTWFPLDDVRLDCSKSRIDTLSIHSHGNKVQLILTDTVKYLDLSGDLSAFEIVTNTGLTSLQLSPTVDSKQGNEYVLPNFEQFKFITSLSILMPILGLPLNCSSLVQFLALENLELRGNCMALSALSELDGLSSIALRSFPNLTDFPTLTRWPKLNYFIGYVLEEKQGKIIQKELKLLQSQKEMQYASISKFKPKNWFDLEYAAPFAGWETKNEKIAIKAFRKAVKLVAKATTLTALELIVQEFVVVFNGLSPMETSEREDVADSLQYLSKAFVIQVDFEQVLQWFDQYREF